MLGALLLTARLALPQQEKLLGSISALLTDGGLLCLLVALEHARSPARWWRQLRVVTALCVLFSWVVVGVASLAPSTRHALLPLAIVRSYVPVLVMVLLGVQLAALRPPLEQRTAPPTPIGPFSRATLVVALRWLFWALLAFAVLLPLAHSLARFYPVGVVLRLGLVAAVRGLLAALLIGAVVMVARRVLDRAARAWLGCTAGCLCLTAVHDLVLSTGALLDGGLPIPGVPSTLEFVRLLLTGAGITALLLALGRLRPSSSWWRWVRALVIGALLVQLAAGTPVLRSPFPLRATLALLDQAVGVVAPVLLMVLTGTVLCEFHPPELHPPEPP